MLTRLATPSMVSVCPGFVPGLSVTEISPSEEMTPTNVGGVPVSETVRCAACAWVPCDRGYAMRSNLCGPIVDVIVSVTVAVLLVNEHVPGAAVVLPDFA